MSAQDNGGPAALQTDAARDVLAERARQISAEGWSTDHDDTHTRNELAEAAACYAFPAPYGVNPATKGLPVPKNWPWGELWWKPKDRRRNLVRAAALLLAEIERLDRAALKGGAK